MGYIDVGIFLAVVEVSPGRLAMHSRPALVGKMFGLGKLELALSDNVTVHTARRFGQQGIEIRFAGSPSYYFWPAERKDQLIRAVSDAGFSVSDAE
jgi:hypothetical protein